MILDDFKVFPRTGRLIGIDWGARRTGVAVSDETHEFVFARDPIVGQKPGELVRAVAKLAHDEHATGIVIGLPLRMDGSESDTTKMVREFAESLATATDVPIIFIDETLSSTAAQEQMGRVRRADIKGKLDSNAARVILENAIAMMGR